MIIRCRLFTAFVIIAGLPAGAKAQMPLAGLPGDKQAANESFLVEGVIEARRNYQIKLQKLRAFYLRTQDVEKRKWVEDELLEYNRIAKRAYRLELEIPPATPPVTRNIPEANELYRTAMIFKDKGLGIEHRDNQLRAEILFQQLITKYSSSDKIALVAYQLGDIYEKWPFQHYHRAARYFERSYQWDPSTLSDGRLRAARLYDHYLAEQAKAIEIYRDVVTHEVDKQQIREATERLEELRR